MLHCPVCGMVLNKLSRSRYFCFSCNREVYFGKNGTTVYDISPEGLLKKYSPDCKEKIENPVDFRVLNHANKKKNNHTGKKKAVVQFDKKTMIEVGRFESISEAYRETGVDISDISLCCRGMRIQAQGYVWRFADV